MTLPLHVLTMAPNDPKNVFLSATPPSRQNFQCPAVKGTVPAGETDSAAVGRYKKKDMRMQLQLEDLKISMFSGKFLVNERHHNPKEQSSKFGLKKLL